MTGANDNGLARAVCILCGKIGFPSIITMKENSSAFICSFECAAAQGVSVPVKNSQLVDKFV